MRYFLVFFRASGRSGEIMGCKETVTRDDEFVRKSDMRYELKLNGYDKVVFTSILELSKEDYQTWNK